MRIRRPNRGTGSPTGYLAWKFREEAKVGDTSLGVIYLLPAEGHQGLVEGRKEKALGSLSSIRDMSNRAHGRVWVGSITCRCFFW